MNEQILKGGYLYYDTPIGVLCLESLFPKPRGHIRNPRTFNFPVVCSVVEGVNIPKLLFDPQPELLQPFIDAAIQLEKDGVKAIAGSCGFLASYQSVIAERVNVPVFMSSLLQIPLVRMMYGKNARIGMLTASVSVLKSEHFLNVGSDINDVFIRGMEGNPEFWEAIILGERHDFDMVKLEAEICGVAREFSETDSLDALILECTDLSAFASPIQKITGIPVYDINSLVEYVNYSVCRKEY